MQLNFKELLAPFFVFKKYLLFIPFLLTSCANVRFPPTPSSDVVLNAVQSIEGIYDSECNVVDFDSFKSIVEGNFPSNIRNLISVSRNGLNLIIIGFRAELGSFFKFYSNDDLKAYKLPNKKIKGILYFYSGEIRGFAYLTAHMVYSSTEKNTLVMGTKPKGKFILKIFYEDGEIKTIEYRTKEINTSIFRRGFQGKWKSEFNGNFILLYSPTPYPKNCSEFSLAIY